MTWPTYKRQRVVKVRLGRKPVDMYHVSPGTVSVGIEMDGSGRLYLTRSSRDGFVQAYELLNASGNQIRYRKPRGAT